MLGARAGLSGSAVVSRVLVLGGYGGFGAPISEALADEGRQVLVAGRSLGRAQAFCAGRAGLTAVQLDRADIAAALRDHAPDIVVDASGPFQAMGYAVPQACIAAGIAYCDIADSTRFVRGIAALDGDAKRAGVPIIAGASSVPALSGAAIRALAAGMSQVSAVEIAISASNRASAGPAVTAAILSQVGQPFSVRCGSGEHRVFGWQEPQRLRFALPGVPPLENRHGYLVDVPDVRLVPDRLPGTPLVTFRAGTELGFQNRALWLLSWPVRWRWMTSLAPLARWLMPLQRLTARWGGERSAMIVRVFGIAAERRVERRWTLIAEHGVGPRIPALSVPPLVAKMLAGGLAPGAYDAGDALTLADYQPAFDRLTIHHAIDNIAQPDPLYRRVMGRAFDALPPDIRALHGVLREAVAEGEADVQGAVTALGRFIGAIMGFPLPGRHTLRVRFSERDGVERWRRQFGDRGFASEMSEQGGVLIERFGPLRFRFALVGDARGLRMVMRGWSVWRIPLPLALAPRSEAHEWAQDGWFQFDVPVALPLIGRLIHYRGRLRPGNH
jgi:hypothetical protein